MAMGPKLTNWTMQVENGDGLENDGVFNSWG